MGIGGQGTMTDIKTCIKRLGAVNKNLSNDELNFGRALLDQVISDLNTLSSTIGGADHTSELPDTPALALRDAQNLGEVIYNS